jgi:hypothetical protein
MPGQGAKEFFKRRLRFMFEVGQHLGINVLPLHFYSGIPDFRDLRRSDYWKRPRSMVGIDGVDVRSQLAFIEECCVAGLIERQRKADIYTRCCTTNGEPGFGIVEADFLFCFLSCKRPRRIVQVGAGLSTAVMLLAAEETTGYAPEITCIDPYPNAFLKEAARLGKINVVCEGAQLVELRLLTDLASEGLLFIDSTHTVKPGSEVNYLLLEVLPLLKKGSWVHFHDIYFPYDYSRGILEDDLFFPNESALLNAFLIHNRKYRLRASLSMVHYASPGRLLEFLPNYRPAKNTHGMRASEGHFPSSAYLQAVE